MDSVRAISVLAASIVTALMAVGFGSGNSSTGSFGDNIRNAADSTILGSNSVTVLPVKLEGVLGQSTVSTDKNLRGDVPEEKVVFVRSNLTETGTGSRLEMRRLGRETGRKATTETTGRQISIGETFPMAEQQTGNNRDKDSQGSKIVQDIRNDYGRFEAGNRYYNEIGHSSNNEETLRVSEVNFHEERPQPGLQHMESNSCRKYLEFLKYAFEQLDSDGRAVDHSEILGRLPRVNMPDWYLLPSTGFGEDGNSTPLQFTNHSSDGQVNDTSAQVSAGTENLTIVKKEEIPAYPVESQAAAETSKDAIEREYNNKLFPCPDNFNVTYPVNGYCNRFVVCESGKPRPEFCQVGLHFNLVTRRCDLPHDSFCTYSCPRANGYFGVPGDCGGFFRCLNWYPEYRMCPPGMHWDVGAKICVFQELSSCPLKCETPYQVKSYGGVCSSYVICSGGEPVFHTCPNEANFEPKLLKCVPQAEYNCTNGEDYIVRYTGLENGRKTLCAKIELKESTSNWCQERVEYQ